MSSSRIEQIIEEIEEFVESCRYQPLSSTKIVVNKEELEELLRELRLKTPEEIKRYQKIISNKDAILADAQAKADNIIADAQARAQELVSQTEIMQKAYAQANETVNTANQQAQGILDSAQQDANNIRVSAISYTDELMANLSQITGNVLAEASERYNAFASALQSYYDVVNRNRSELAAQGAVAPAAPADEDDDLPEVSYDDGDDE
jgi:cell division septum initiation protein DivIVA